MRAPVEAPLAYHKPDTRITSPEWLEFFQRLFDISAPSGAHIYYDLAGSGRRFYIVGVSIEVGTDEFGAPKEYPTPILKEL